MIRTSTLKKLELKKVLEDVAEYSQSVSAKNMILSTLPEVDSNKVKRLLDETDEAVKLINFYNVSPGFNFDSVREIADKAKILSTLSMKELLYVKRILSTSRYVSNAFSGVEDEEIFLLRQYTSMIYCNRSVEESIEFAVISEDEMNDRASDELYRIRTAIRRTNDEIKQKLNSYLHSSSISKYMQDSLITVREQRYVIPVKTEYKSYVPGLIHDQSASGATVFIEPMAIVNLNNKLKELYIDEKNEIERILTEFTSEISKFSDRLKENENILAYLDAVFSKAKYANDTRCTMPIVNDKGYIDIRNGRHPLIEKDKVVPISVRLGSGYNILLITGPNTGGKTVSLKTVGLFVLMAGCGLMLPCSRDSEISVFDNIFCDIGDEQSIEQSLSTFSGHITNISEIVKELSPRTLVLLDEIGAGTEPNEGAALAMAITEFILDSGAKAIITTHYSQLKEYSLITPGIENASMEFDPSTFAPTYKLIIGVPGSSNAIEIASRLGLDKKITEAARSKLSEEKISFENVLRQAESIRQRYEKTNEEIENIRNELAEELKKAKKKNEILAKERENLLFNSKQEAKRIVISAQEKAKELIEEIKDIKKKAAFSGDDELFKARATAKKIGELKYDIEKDIEKENEELLHGPAVDIKKLKPGDKVYVLPLKSTGVVADIKKGDQVTVKIGKITSYLKPGDLYTCIDDQQKAPEKVSVKSNILIKTVAVPKEINLLGKNVDEAIIEVDPFIDRAIAEKYDEVRIIHGMGTGALRAGLHKYFKTDKRIASFRLGKYGEGESGVTILTLKH